MTRYRYRTPTWTGRWHETQREAQEAAIKVKAGYRDPLSDRFYANIFTKLDVL
jgi:hypothetical protein